MGTRKIILTGFMPFGGYAHNPVQHATEYFNGKNYGPCCQRQVIGVVLPYSYFAAFNILSEIIDREKPDAILSTGLASSARGIRIETRFCNNMNGKYADCDGFRLVNIPIKNIAPPFYEATADALKLSSVLSARNIPNELSEDADEFICNALGYLTSRKIICGGLDIKNTFVHVPWTDEYKDIVPISPDKMYLQKEVLYEALEVLLRTI